MTGGMTGEQWVILICAAVVAVAVVCILAATFIGDGRDAREERAWARRTPARRPLPDIPGTGWQPTGRLAVWTRATTARVMADPLRSARARTADFLIAAIRAQQSRPPVIRVRVTRPAYVSGPAVVPDPPAAEPSTPRGGEAGPETPPLHDHSRITDPWVCQACADEVAEYGWPEGEEPEPYEDDDEDDDLTFVHMYQRADGSIVPADSVTGLPPVDQAAHLQPIEWADATGSFAAICEVRHG